jgi:hypothetical protein
MGDQKISGLNMFIDYIVVSKRRCGMRDDDTHTLIQREQQK